jgi:tetratricopeptide (TPR) repeat protein
VLVGISLLGLLVPAGIGARLYHVEDRTGDHVAFDYGYNILQSCEQNSLLFTNGDNDTFPLWYLQEVEGIRKDVRVINLSLLNTGWYIKQLRDREPKVAISLPDSYIDSVLTDTHLVDLYKRAWQEPVIAQVRKTMKESGFDVEYKPQPGHDLMRIQDVMIIGLLKWNQWKRPVHFAITVAGSNRLSLDPYLRMSGMTLRLVRERDLGPDMERLEQNLFKVYRFRNLTDADVFQDLNTARLLGNYRACVLQLAELYQRDGKGEEMVHLMNWARERLPFGWETFYSAGEYLAKVDQVEMAAEYIEMAGLELVQNYGQSDVASYDNITTIGSILLNEPYSSTDRAEGLYRAAIAREPQRWDAYFELAATLQAKGDATGGIKLLSDYRSRYGEVQQLVEAEQVLQNALQKRTTPAESSLVRP